jgi:hypothetical protein
MGRLTSKTLLYFLLLPSKWSCLEAKENKTPKAVQRNLREKQALNKSARCYYEALKRMRDKN